MLCGTPVIASAAGGALELVEHDATGWLVTPGDSAELAAMIHHCYKQPEQTSTIVDRAKFEAARRFHLDSTNRQIAQLLNAVVGDKGRRE